MREQGCISCTLIPLLHRRGNLHVNRFEGYHCISLWKPLHWCLCVILLVVTAYKPSSTEIVKVVTKGHGPEVSPNHLNHIAFTSHGIGPGDWYCGNRLEATRE